ncbi:MAG: aminoglycoside phosphotransferase family protein [Candidatus Peribacteraceae bacterium]|nr:aminoglycoside phosphotransferase family protein [Candidatus Peribacteraceae bacterium]
MILDQISTPTSPPPPELVSAETTDHSIDGEQADVRAVTCLLLSVLGQEKVIHNKRLSAGENSIAYEIELEGKGPYIFLVVKSRNAQKRLRRLHESRIMEQIEPPLPFAFPRFEFASIEDPFIVGYPKIPGESLTKLLNTISDTVLEDVGRKVRAFHNAPSALVEQAPDSIVPPLVTLLGSSYLETHVQPKLPSPLFKRLEILTPRLLDEWKSLESPLSLTHGDLGPDHILIDTATDGIGMIDPERLCNNDPDSDLWKLTRSMNPHQLEAVLRGYGHHDRTMFERKRLFFHLQRILDQLAWQHPKVTPPDLEKALDALKS